MRILFQLPAPSYLRMYGTTLRLLADRGHHVLISYDHPDKRRDPAADAMEAHERIELVPPLPNGSRPNEQAIADRRVAIDYLRFLDRRFERAEYLRRRLDKFLRGRWAKLARMPYGMPGASALMKRLLKREAQVPSDLGIEQAIASRKPDAVFVSPLIGRTVRSRAQTDTVKSAQALGIPVAHGVASWDHLTTKGIVKAVADRMLVWNELQVRDAEELHFVPPERVVVTGAPMFDPMFERAGAPAEPRHILYVGSSPNIAPSDREIPFVRGWIEALRAGGITEPVLVRPHPDSTAAWADVQVDGEVEPRVSPPLPMSEADEALYIDQIAQAHAVVGINTTAMIVAFVLRKPVLTIRAEEFAAGQEGTLHFQRLREAAPGALLEAGSLDEHVAQLRATLADPVATRAAVDAFLLRFVRPHGLDRPAAPILADAIEALVPRVSETPQESQRLRAET